MREDMMPRDKKMIKRDILDKFRSVSHDTDMLPPSWLESDYLNQLNRQEKMVFKKAVKELVSCGLVENVKGATPNLKLTQKGADLIY